MCEHVKKTKMSQCLDNQRVTENKESGDVLFAHFNFVNVKLYVN